MAGNVWDWVGDWYSDDYYSISPYLNPIGPALGNYKGYRGGSFGSYFLRVAPRSYDFPDDRSGTVGFRCAAPPAP
jgi:formylglycine-generating enzyme required for sulfatase activity